MINILLISSNGPSFFKQYTGAKSQRKMSLDKQRLARIEDSGHLQAVTEFPHDEVLILDKW
jgi:hypothetical protein